MAAMIRFAICVVLINVILCYAPDSWKLFSTKQSDKSKFHVLHDWPTDEGSYLDDYTESIVALEISDVMLQTMGIFRHTLDWQGVRVKNLFKRPQATALFVLDGLVDEVTEPSKSYSVSQRGLHGDLRSDLISMFEGDHVLRYFNRLFDGKGMSLLLSGDKESALQISGANSDGGTLFDKMQLRLVEFPVPVSFDSNHATIDVDSNSASFDLNDEVDLFLFTELAMMMNTVETLPVDKISDGVPDVFVLAVSSLQSIRAKYGGDSVQMKAASQLTSACVTKMNNKLVDVYNGDIITQLLALVWEEGSNVEDGTVDDPNSICATIRDFYGSHFVACQGTTCKSISCDGVVYQRVRRSDYVAYAVDDDEGNNTDTGISCDDLCPDESYSRTEDFSAIFAIIAFITIALLAAVFGISWAMWTMDPGEDSIVYQMTAPRMKTD